MAPASEDESPWHAGELRAQVLSGSDHRPGGAGIRGFMPDQHRLFFAQLPFLVAGTVDATGAAMATLLVGEPGFATSPDPNLLVVLAKPDDPTGRRLVEGAPIGLLGIELHTRRRNRANGRVAFTNADGLLVNVEQSFGNCPQYIHPRVLAIVDREVEQARELTGLDEEARAQISAADTFFVATSSGPGVEHGGVDVSHRGGPPGFVQIAGDTLTIPDYRGNRYFNTLGNLVLDPRTALLFVDLQRGRLLQLQGTAEITWDEHALPGAERTWRLKVERGWRGGTNLRQVEG